MRGGYLCGSVALPTNSSVRALGQRGLPMGINGFRHVQRMQAPRLFLMTVFEPYLSWQFIILWRTGAAESSVDDVH